MWTAAWQRRPLARLAAYPRIRKCRKHKDIMLRRRGTTGAENL